MASLLSLSAIDHDQRRDHNQQGYRHLPVADGDAKERQDEQGLRYEVPAAVAVAARGSTRRVI